MKFVNFFLNSLKGPIFSGLYVCYPTTTIYNKKRIKGLELRCFKVDLPDIKLSKYLEISSFLIIKILNITNLKK